MSSYKKGLQRVACGFTHHLALTGTRVAEDPGRGGGDLGRGACCLILDSRRGGARSSKEGRKGAPMAGLSQLRHVLVLVGEVVPLLGLDQGGRRQGVPAKRVLVICSECMSSCDTGEHRRGARTVRC